MAQALATNLMPTQVSSAGTRFFDYYPEIISQRPRFDSLVKANTERFDSTDRKQTAHLQPRLFERLIRAANANCSTGLHPLVWLSAV